MTFDVETVDRIRATEPSAIVIFGASGDLTRRKLIPSLYLLHEDGLLPSNFKIIGVARSVMSDVEFIDSLEDGIVKYCRRVPASKALWDEFSEKVTYVTGGYDDADTYRTLGSMLGEAHGTGHTGGNCLFYLAIPPTLYETVIRELGESGLSGSQGAGWTRLIIEKPFGRNLKSAQALNELVHRYFGEDQIYRIDHYLGKETVQNILSFRFANSIFEPIWNRNFVDHVQISVLEQVGVGHRGGYYENAGVLRDMFQNHLLQLLSLTAMEPPVALNAKELRDEKVKVLQAIDPIQLRWSVGGQYTTYRENPGVDPNSRTPTYFAMRLFVNSWRWQGVPFYVRSGKNLTSKTSEIVLQFKQVPHLLFEDSDDMSSNTLSLCIQPDEGMHLQFETKIPGAGMRTEPVLMDFHYGDRFGKQALPDAYERLILDALKGDASLFSRSDEIVRAWELIDPLIQRWEGGEEAPVNFYEPGSWGPTEADELIAEHGHAWRLECGGHN
ncbi:MAG: glucose-6-phosphate dehydrogenase [Anaerolineales bacterium]|nr:glucose-6-phosphate dehydrogenase [Anaerolineales bacterium]